MRKKYIYLVGVVLLGLVYEPLKLALPNGPVFLFSVVTYLLVVNWLAHRMGKP